MKKIIWGLIIFSIIDVTYTAIGAFYGGGGAELNPLFSWITNPIQFVIFVSLIKMVALSIIIIGILRLNDHEIKHQHETKFAKPIGKGANVVYSILLMGIIMVNIWYQIAGG